MPRSAPVFRLTFGSPGPCDLRHTGRTMRLGLRDHPEWRAVLDPRRRWRTTPDCRADSGQDDALLAWWSARLQVLQASAQRFACLARGEAAAAGGSAGPTRRGCHHYALAMPRARPPAPAFVASQDGGAGAAVQTVADRRRSATALAGDAAGFEAGVEAEVSAANARIGARGPMARPCGRSPARRALGSGGRRGRPSGCAYACNTSPAARSWPPERWRSRRIGAGRRFRTVGV